MPLVKSCSNTPSSLFMFSPEKAILNLTTSVAGLKFSPTSEMLAMHSELKENAIKLAHVPSMTVSGVDCINVHGGAFTKS